MATFFDYHRVFSSENARKIVLNNCALQFITLIFIFSGCKDLIAMEAEATQRDKILCNILVVMHEMKACKEAKDYLAALHINSDAIAKEWLARKEEFNCLRHQFINDNSGVTKKDLWKIFLASEDAQCKSVAEYAGNLPCHPSKKVDPLMTLASNMVDEVVSKNSLGFKLDNLFRGNEESVVKFRELLTSSYTLHVPLTRALNRARSSQKPFTVCLLEELEEGYWQDASFTAGMQYLKEYFRYEFVLAQTRPKLVKQYKGLLNDSAAGLAERYVANYIVLNVVNPFLQKKQVPQKEIKIMSGGDDVAIEFEQRRPSFAASSPVWHEITQIILGKNPTTPRNGQTALVNDKDVISFGHGKTKLDIFNDVQGAVEQLNIAFNEIPKELMTLKLLVKRILEHIIIVTFNPDVILWTTDLMVKYVEAIADLKGEEEYKTLNNQFYELQKAIRSAEHWKSGGCHRIFNRQYDGNNLKDYIGVFADNDWQIQTDTLHRLTNIQDVVNDKHLYMVLNGLAQIFTPYVKFLTESDVMKLLETLAKLNMAAHFRYVEQHVIKMEKYSQNSEFIQESRKRLAATIATNTSPITKSKTLNHELYFTYPQKGEAKQTTVKLTFQLNAGIGGIVKHLNENKFFEDVDNETLTAIARQIKVVVLPQGAVLYQEDNSFAMINYGQVKVLVNDQAQKVKSKILGVGKTFNEISLFLPDQKRIATVKASGGEAKVYVINNAAFRKIAINNPKIMYNIFLNLARKVALARKSLIEDKMLIFSKEKDVFSRLTNHQLFTLNREFKEEGSVDLVSNSKNLFYLDSGNVEIMLNDEKMSTLEPGKYLNAINFFVQETAAPLSFKACVGQECKLFYLPKKGFEKLVNKHPEIIWSIAMTLAEILNDYQKQRASPADNLLFFDIAKSPTLSFSAKTSTL